MPFPLRRIGRDLLIAAGLSVIPLHAHLGAVLGVWMIGLYAVPLIQQILSRRPRHAWWPVFGAWLSLVVWTILMPAWFTAAYWHHALHTSVAVWIQSTVPLMLLGFLGDASWTLVRTIWTHPQVLAVSDWRKFLVKESFHV